MKRLFFILFLFITCPFLSMGQKTYSASVALPGRFVSATGIPKPSITTQESGVVVIQIKVDQYGRVKKATVDKAKTTIKDRTICNSALEAAMNTQFNMSALKPKRQKGTITYRFGNAINLKTKEGDSNLLMEI